MAATRRLTGMGHGNAHDITKVKCIIAALAQDWQWSELLQAEEAIVDKSILPARINHDFSVMKAKVKYLEDTCRVLVLEATCGKSRIRDLSQAVGSTVPVMKQFLPLQDVYRRN